MKTIDEPMPICEAEMERLEDQLVEDCKSLGMAESIRDFLQEPFSEWMDELADESSGGDDSSPECRLSRNGAGALAIAMQQTMAVRDALLVSIIVDERRSSRDFLMGFMANPTLPGNTRHLEESLNGSFRDASRKPDTKRCDNGVNVMFDIIGMVMCSHWPSSVMCCGGWAMSAPCCARCVRSRWMRIVRSRRSSAPRRIVISDRHGPKRHRATRRKEAVLAHGELNTRE